MVSNCEKSNIAIRVNVNLISNNLKLAFCHGVYVQKVIIDPLGSSWPLVHVA